MGIANLENFIVDYFNANGCKVIENANGMIRIQLTKEMDEALMNRPFYWHYIRSLGQEGQPMALNLITNPEKRNDKGEWIHFGSPRLQQIWNYLIQKEKYVLLFQEIHATKNTPLYPWLLANIKISYKGKLKKEEIISLGIQLINGKIIVNMMDELDKLSLKQQISNYCYTLSPLITVKSAYLRLETLIINYIEKQPKEWADDSRKTLEDELDILKHFYLDRIDDEILEKEIAELKNRYEPEIDIDVINGGLIYLSSTF